MLQPGQQIVTIVEVAALYRKSRWWARRLLRQWYAEQLEGGEHKVIMKRDKAGRERLVTTRAIIARELPQARDHLLIRRVDALEKDLTNLARRLDRVFDEKTALERRVTLLERPRASQALGEPIRQPGLANGSRR